MMIVVFSTLTFLVPAISAISATLLSPSVKQRTFFATTVSGLENLLVQEIRNIIPDAVNIQKGKCGVKYVGSDDVGYRSLIWLRTPLKVMELLTEDDNIRSRDELYNMCYSIPWMDIMSVEQSIKCDTIMGTPSPDLSHSHFNSLTLKNAVVDHFRDRIGRRPSVDIENPDLSLCLYLHKSKASLYRVWSGDSSMHKRGYREKVHRAALRETTAAAL